MLKTSAVVPSPNRQKDELRQGAHASHGFAFKALPRGKIMASNRGRRRSDIFRGAARAPTEH
jgi:hypothetical protein